MNKMFNNRAGFGMMGIIIAIVIVVVALLAIFLVFYPWEKEPIKIGAVLTISGPGGYNGVEVRDGILLAVDEINSWGGINGRKIALIIKDSKTNPQESMKAFNKIEDAHHPLLYVSMFSSVSLALASLAEENEVVLVGLVTAITKVTEKKRWTFRYWLRAEDEVPPIMSILQELKIKKLGILFVDNEYGTFIFELLKKEFEAIGGVVRGEGFRPNEFDYKEKIERLKDMEAIYGVGFASHLKNIFKQLKEKDYAGFMLGSNGASGSLVTSIPEANGAYVSSPIIYNTKYLFAKELKEKYEARYEKPLTQFAANGYDFIKLLAGLLEDEQVSRESVKGLLEGGFIHPGVFGNIDVKPGEHNFAFPLHPARIVDGKIKFLR